MKVPAIIRVKVTSSLKGSILNLIQRDYQFIAGEKIQHMFAGEVVEWWTNAIETHGNWTWADFVIWCQGFRKPNYGENSKNTTLTPIVLTLISKDDLKMGGAGYSDRKIKEKKTARLLKEAYDQGALLAHAVWLFYSTFLQVL